MGRAPGHRSKLAIAERDLLRRAKIATKSEENRRRTKSWDLLAQGRLEDSAIRFTRAALATLTVEIFRSHGLDRAAVLELLKSAEECW